MKKWLLIVSAFILVVSAGLLLWQNHTNNEQLTTKTPTDTSQANVTVKPSIANTPEPATTAKPPERADYLYNTYTQSSHTNRYDDLKTKKYITDSMYKSAQEAKEYDLITCSQNPAKTYTIQTNKETATIITLTVVGQYDQKARDFTETWVKNGDIWQLDNVICPTT